MLGEAQSLVETFYSSEVMEAPDGGSKLPAMVVWGNLAIYIVPRMRQKHGVDKGNGWKVMRNPCESHLKSPKIIEIPSKIIQNKGTSLITSCKILL